MNTKDTKVTKVKKNLTVEWNMARPCHTDEHEFSWNRIGFSFVHFVSFVFTPGY